MSMGFPFLPHSLILHPVLPRHHPPPIRLSIAPCPLIPPFNVNSTRTAIIKHNFAIKRLPLVVRNRAAVLKHKRSNRPTNILHLTIPMRLIIHKPPRPLNIPELPSEQMRPRPLPESQHPITLITSPPRISLSASPVKHAVSPHTLIRDAVHPCHIAPSEREVLVILVIYSHSFHNSREWHHQIKQLAPDNNCIAV